MFEEGYSQCCGGAAVAASHIGETFNLCSAFTEEQARLDVVASGVGGGRFKKTFIYVLVNFALLHSSIMCLHGAHKVFQLPEVPP